MNEQKSDAAEQGGVEMPAKKIVQQLKSRQRKRFSPNSRKGPLVYRGMGYHPRWCQCKDCLPNEPRPNIPEPPRRDPTLGSLVAAAIGKKFYWANRDVVLRQYKVIVGSDDAHLEAN